MIALFRACIFGLIVLASVATAQQSDFIKEIRSFQDQLNKEYKSKEDSPLDPSDRKKFKQHEFFPIDLNYRVTANLDRNVDLAVFPMKTTTSRIANYRKYAIASFEINGEAFQLTIYQSTELLKRPGFEDYLFLPFTDKTTGDTTYGGGRYIDLRIPAGDEIIIDFNKAYNPYCAYSVRYSCPRVPDENSLPIEILAGIKYSTTSHH